MPTNKSTNSAPSFYFNGYVIETSYSFSTYYSASGNSKTSKVWLDIVFMHPIREEVVTVRTAKSIRILSQPKEVIDAIAQRDIVDFLSFSNLSFHDFTGRNELAVAV